jgi:membrane peptidoglycan carboxypeptidase
VQGGSTLTQQVAKNVFLTAERSLERKLKELPMALALELKYTKDEILSIYLNRVYLGAGTYGFEAASQRYFGKSARLLNPAEAAMA